MNSQEFNQLQLKISSMIFQFGIVDDYLADWNSDSAVRLMKALIPELGKLITAMEQSKENLEELGIPFEAGEIVPIIKNMLDAQEKQDYMFLLSTIRMELIPKFQMYYWMLNDVSVMNRQDHLEEHLSALEKCSPELCLQIRQYIGSGREALDGTAYSVDAAENAQPIIKKKTEQDEFYFYSTDRPVEDMRNWVKGQMRTEVSEYHLFESGLIYAGRSLLRLSAYTCRVHEYFSNMYMLVQCFRYGYYVPYLGRNIFFHYDPDLLLLTKAMKDQRAQTMLYLPAIRDLENEQLKNIMMKYYTASNSARVSSILLNGNFYSNIRIPDISNVDELRTNFQGKKVFIVAAGPSLDKNFEELRNLPENSILVATGTIYRKLSKAGIRPDYVILSEANARVVAQLEVCEPDRKTVPLILLSTATTNAYREYPGPKYIVYQYEFAPAERAASEKNRTLYMTGGSVSTLALDIAIRLGANSIVFAGLDLAFTDSKSHSNGTGAQMEVDMTGMTAVPSTDGGVVYADSKFMLYRDWFKRRLKMEDTKKISVIDATEGGALIEGMRVMTLADAKKE